MLGHGLQFPRSRNGEGRFYCASRAHQSCNQPLSQDHLRRAQSAVTDGLPEVHKAVAAQKPPLSPEHSNLDRFLESVSPSVTAQYLSKTTMKGWRTCDIEYQPYFVLSDLWEAFKEWSAYGAGVPLVLDSEEDVVQYYVPSLSGIQLFGGAPKKSGKPGEDSDGDSPRESSSGRSSDRSSDTDERNYAHTVDNALVRLGQMTLQEGPSSDESEAGSSRGSLLYEFFETDLPYGRKPLSDMVSKLSAVYPGLQKLRSCDLLPSSWVSVAWYPIYRIPTGPTLKDLDASFLTFHSLHTPVTGSQNVAAPIMKYPSGVDGTPKIVVPVFGLEHYKFKPALWIPGGGAAQEKLTSLLKEAEQWLAQRRVYHPDFSFFHQR